MKENGVSGPSSLVYVQAKDLYPKKQFVFGLFAWNIIHYLNFLFQHKSVHLNVGFKVVEHDKLS